MLLKVSKTVRIAIMFFFFLFFPLSDFVHMTLCDTRFEYMGVGKMSWE